MRYLSHRDYPASPWKNGGGVTHQVAVWPDDAGLDDFAWRVSLAELNEAGPFSPYPGISRSLLLLDGGPVALDIDGKAVTLVRHGAPLSFAGSANVSAHPESTALDAGVMSRDGICRHRCHALTLHRSLSLLRRAPQGLLLAEGGPLRVVTPEGMLTLERLDALRFEPGDAAQLTLEADSPARLLFAEFEPWV